MEKRIIKFKAWDSKNNMFLDLNQCFIWLDPLSGQAFAETTGLRRSFKGNKCIHFKQYIGKNDFKGAEIYETDFCLFDVQSINGHEPIYGLKGEVKYEYGIPTLGGFNLQYCTNIIRIGNVLETPELLKLNY